MEVDGHLSTSYLKREIVRLRFEPPVADDVKSLLVAGGIAELPRPASGDDPEAAAADRRIRRSARGEFRQLR
jgi:hypothetical protein